MEENLSPPLPRLDGVRVLALFGGERLFGQERANIEVFRNMEQLGLKVRFVTSSKWGHGEIQPELDRLGFEWTTAPFGYHWTRHMLGRHFGYFLLNLYGVVATSWKLWREVRRWKPTHLYVMNWLYFSYGAPAILLLRQPLVYRAGDELPTHTAFHRWLTTKLFRRVNGMVCVSKFILERCAAAGMVRERMRVVYSNPPERANAALPGLPSVPAGRLVVAYVGQVSEHKGIVILLDAVERMIKRGRDLTLWIAGDPCWDAGLFGALKQRVATAELQDRLVFLGYIKNVFPVLLRADIHVCPSLFADPLPNVVGEAKLCSRPSVVFPVGGLPELIEHKVDGYLCQTCTADALAEGIDYFMMNPPERQKAGAAARRSLEEKFGLEQFRRQWAEVFLATANSRAQANKR